jgi:hypothetical protein
LALSKTGGACAPSSRIVGDRAGAAGAAADPEARSGRLASAIAPGGDPDPPELAPPAFVALSQPSNAVHSKAQYVADFIDGPRLLTIARLRRGMDFAVESSGGLMFTTLRASSIIILLVLIAAPVSAQTRMPDKGMVAVGLWAGIAMPSDDVLADGWFIGVSGERYFTPRVSIRGQFGGAFWDVTGGGLDGKVSPMFLAGNLVHNWERGKWHPYAGGGIGWYRYRFGEGSNRLADSKAGANLVGGIEYFFGARDTIVGEATFHLVPGHAESGVWAYQAKFWVLSGGYKRYF